MKQKKSELKKHFLNALANLVYLAIIIIGVSAYLIHNEKLIGPAFLVLGLANLLVIRWKGIERRFILSDLTFGFVDNSIMVFGAIIGANFGGVIGAIIGGAAGNTLTDGIGGLVEGYVAEKQNYDGDKNLRRMMLTGTLGKITGCLLGAGVSLSLVALFKFLF